MIKPLAGMRALLFALIVACGDRNEDVWLSDRHFILQSASGFALVAETTVHLYFEDGRVSVGADCNGMSGAYQVAGGRLIIASLSETQRGCSAEMLDQDARLRSFMEADPLLARDGDWLSLSVGGAVLRFVDSKVVDPDRPLVGTVWAIDTLIDEQTFGSSPTGAHPLMQFAGDGSVHVLGTCNSGVGRYAIEGKWVTVTNVAYTEKACTDEAGAILDQKIKTVLSAGSLHFEIEARRLTLMSDRLGLSGQAQLAQADPDAGGP